MSGIGNENFLTGGTGAALFGGGGGTDARAKATAHQVSLHTVRKYLADVAVHM